jgi:hypothetical protein
MARLPENEASEKSYKEDYIGWGCCVGRTPGVAVGLVEEALRVRRPRAARPYCDRSAFAGFRFPPEVITVAVRWYLRYGLSHRDVEELLAERGVEVDHVTVYRWVQRFTPLFADAARPTRHGSSPEPSCMARRRSK